MAEMEMWPNVVGQTRKYLTPDSGASSSTQYSVIGGTSEKYGILVPSDGTETPMILLENSKPKYVLVANNGIYGAQALIQVFTQISVFGYAEHAAEPGRFYITPDGDCLDTTLNPKVAENFRKFSKTCAKNRAVVQLVGFTDEGYVLGRDPIAKSVTAKGY